MKLSTVLAITFCVALVSAAPHHHSNWNKEININNENNSRVINNNNDEGKKIGQNLGSVGSGSSGGILGGGILSKTENTNNVGQTANIH
jgi:hypothetical protein